MSTHPGKWSAKFGENDGYDCMTAAWTISNGTRTVCMVDYQNWNANHFDSTRIPEADAAAHLIAAAPEMYEALQSVLARGCSCRNTEDENWHAPKSSLGAACPIPLVKAALAKARGEQ